MHFVPSNSSEGVVFEEMGCPGRFVRFQLFGCQGLRKIIACPKIPTLRASVVPSATEWAANHCRVPWTKHGIRRCGEYDWQMSDIEFGVSHPLRLFRPIPALPVPLPKSPQVRECLELLPSFGLQRALRTETSTGHLLLHFLVSGSGTTLEPRH